MSWDQPLSSRETKAIVSKAVDSAVSNVTHSFSQDLMRLATSQARAMEDLGEHIDGRIYRLDEANEKRFIALTNGLVEFSRDLDKKFAATNRNIARVMDGIDGISARLDDIASRLDDIEFNTANPELTRAYERYHTALDLAKRGHFDDALTRINAAIDNSDGPAMTHIPEFQVFKASLLLREDADFFDPSKALTCLETAAKFAEGEWKLRDRASIEYLAGQAAAASHDPLKAGLKFAMCFTLTRKCAKQPSYLQPHSVLFQLARQHLLSLTMLNELKKSEPSISEEYVMSYRDKAAFALMKSIEIDWSVIGWIPTDPVMMSHSEFVTPVLNDFWEKHGPIARESVKRYVTWVDDDVAGQVNAKIKKVADKARTEYGRFPPPKEIEIHVGFTPDERVMETFRKLLQEDSRPLDFVALHHDDGVKKFISELWVKDTVKRCDIRVVLDDIIYDPGRRRSDYIRKQEHIPMYLDSEIRDRSRKIIEDKGLPWVFPNPPAKPASILRRWHHKKRLERYYKAFEVWKKATNAIEAHVKHEYEKHVSMINKDYEDRLAATISAAEEVLEFLASIESKDLFAIADPKMAEKVDWKKLI